jgi:hypothetical protein
MTRPNLFHFATSELSQDAFLCWLLEWANPKYCNVDPGLHQCGANLIRLIFELHAKRPPDNIATVEVLKQQSRIDVLCIVNGEYAIIIEDKTTTSEHGDQLTRYAEAVKSDGFVASHILPVFFKTHEQSGFSNVEEAGYKVLSRGQLLALFRSCGSANDILADYRAELEALDASFENFVRIPVADWNWQSWQGFYQRLQRELGIKSSCWGYVPNPNGGFLGFWWHWFHDTKAECDVYLQLEHGCPIGKLCVKIGDVAESVRSSARSRWHGLVLEEARQSGLSFTKPGRFGNGTCMTVAVLSDDFRKCNDLGILDLEATVLHLRKAEAMLASLFAALPSSVGANNDQGSPPVIAQALA